MHRTAFLGIALVSGAIVFAEIALTRLFSFRLWYHYAFMIISIALLGLSGAATATALLRERLRAIPAHRFLGYCSILFGLSLVISLQLLMSMGALLSVDTDTSPGRAFLSIAAYWSVLFVPFFLAGATVSWAIETYADRISLAYAFDLVGAGLGAAVAAQLLFRMHPETALHLAAGLGVGAGLLFHASASGLSRGVLAASAGTLLLGALSCTGGGALMGPRITASKGLAQDLAAGSRLLETRPNTNGRVDAVSWPVSGFVWGLRPDARASVPEQVILRIDGDALTTITRFDGDFDKWRFSDVMPSSLPYAVRQPDRVLLIGPGGGPDVVNALGRGASHVTGVEVNRRVIELVRGPFGEFSGHIYDRPDVEIIHSDGRNFVEATDERYDLVQLTLVDTFAAIASGALSLSEDFLYTTEAFRAYLRALAPEGVLALGRTTSEALSLSGLMHAATRDQDLDLGRHLFIADNPALSHSLVFLYSPTPFQAEEIERGVAFTRRAGMRVRYAPGLEAASDPEVVGFLNAEDRDAFLVGYPRDVVPETDDRPFYFRASKWSDVLGTYRGGRGNLWIILAVSVVFAVGVILVPLGFAAPGAVRGNGTLLAFFGLVGLGFIFLELALLTRFVLFLGHPVRSLTVTLFSLLVFSGVGSAASRLLLRRSRGDPAGEGALPLLALPLLGVVALAVVYGVWLSDLFAGAMGLHLNLRIALAVAMVAPLGFLMGMPIPIGIAVLASRRRELVLWAWGLNGVASVTGSVGCILLAHAAGHTATFLAAAAAYAVAALLFLRVRPAVAAAA